MLNAHQLFVKIPMLIFRLFNLVLILLAYHGGATAQPAAEIQSNGYSSLGNFDSSMPMVVVFLVFAFFMMGVLSIYIRRCSESATGNSVGAGSPANSGISRRKGLDQAVIDTFPILVYSSVKDLKVGKGALECAVCLSEFDDYETLRLLPKCDHVFHPSCIDSWLVSHATCPVCRANLGGGDPKRDPNPANSGPAVVDEVRNDDVAVNVDDNQSGDPQAVEMACMTVRSEISRKLAKSHSTGHSLIRPGDNTERCTLRLPAEVRRQLLSTGNNKLRRSSSYDVVLPLVGSSRMGYRDGGGGGEGKRSVDNQSGWFDPWALWRTPSFVARIGSVTVKSPKGGDTSDGAFGKTPSRSVRIPLDCLNVKADKSNESISQLPV